MPVPGQPPPDEPIPCAKPAPKPPAPPAPDKHGMDHPKPGDI